MEQTPFWAYKAFRQLMIGVVAVLIIFVAVLAIGEFKRLPYIGQDVPVENTITVSGKGELFAIPDIATFSFSVLQFSATVPEAQKNVTDKMHAVLASLKTLGVDDKDVKTVDYGINPRYEYKQVTCVQYVPCPPGRQVLTGYEVNQSVSVKVRKIDDSGKIIGAMGSLSVSNLSGLSFTLDKEDDLKKQARVKAINDARDQAKSLAHDLGVSLVRIVSFSESGNYPVYLYASKGMATDAAIAPSAPEIPTGQNKITSNVSVTYEIR
ncbi:SIMPL domain-containing protein [Candidatus Parcubacteria bacterium]|nr:SIMPL domain-containing protein [Candidatus Parcubacteria bacterium]